MERCDRNSCFGKVYAKGVLPVFELYLAVLSVLIAAISLLYTIESKMDARRALK